MSILDDNMIDSTAARNLEFPNRDQIQIIDAGFFPLLRGYIWVNPYYIKNQVFKNGLAIGVYKSPWPRDDPYSIWILYKVEKDSDWSFWERFTSISHQYSCLGEAYNDAYQILLSIQDDPGLLHIKKKIARCCSISLKKFNIYK